MTTIQTPGPPLTEDEMAALERSLGLPVPAKFRMFLLRVNGGRPSPNTIDIVNYSGSPTDTQVVFGIGREIETSNVEWNVRVLGSRLGASFLPVACDSGGNIFGLSLRNNDFGMVYYFDLDAVYGEADAPPPEYLVANDFDDFLGRLREL